MTPIIELRHVTRVHGTGRLRVEALVDVSLTASSGELVAVMGPSGSGKTTLLSLAGGLDHPTDGNVFVERTDMAGLRPSELARMRRRRIGYVFQQFNLIDGLTAAENVSLPLELDGVERRKAMRLALEALERVGLDGLSERFPDDLSGGEQQRVAIARAVVGDRLVLLADEPTGALDSITGEAVLRLMREHCDRGGCGLLVTHDARFAAWGDRIIFLRDGRVVDQTDAPAGPESLLSHPVAP
jgi:putative ABC transport system ATP-binding protein